MNRLPNPRAVLAALWLAAAAVVAHAADTPDYSPAEKLLFMSNQLGALKLPQTLRYSFSHGGSLDEAYDDKVSVAVTRKPGEPCCSSRAEFLSGARRLPLPDVDGATGNPVLMFFLERDVREMQRLTKGSQNHFRKRVRMALYQAADVHDVTLSYRGRDIRGHEVVISPYLDDPNRPRYEQLARKEYRFLLSDAVPGGLYGIRTRVVGADAGAPPLLAEDLLIEGAAAPAPAARP